MLGGGQVQHTATSQWQLCQLTESCRGDNGGGKNPRNFQRQRSSLLPVLVLGCSSPTHLDTNLLHTFYSTYIHAARGVDPGGRRSMFQSCCVAVREYPGRRQQRRRQLRPGGRRCVSFALTQKKSHLHRIFRFAAESPIPFWRAGGVDEGQFKKLL